MSSPEQPMQIVLTQYVIENANLKLTVEELKQRIAELEKENTEKRR